MVILNDLELIVQALRNVGNTFGGRTKIVLHSLAKEIDRLVTVQRKEQEREFARRVRENDKAKKIGAKLPYPDDDIPF